MRTFLIFIFFLLVVPFAILWTMSSTPAVILPASVTALGQATPLTVHVADPHGVKQVSVTVEQNGMEYAAGEVKQSSRRFHWQRNVADNESSRRSQFFNLAKEDKVPDLDLNEVIWKSVKGENSVMPAPKRSAFVILEKKKKDDDD